MKKTSPNKHTNLEQKAPGKHQFNTQMSDQPKISVAFVCLGNICRSPMAEAVFKHTVRQQHQSHRFHKIESFGTARYHVGETPDSRSTAACAKHGVPVDHRAQQIKSKHFEEFDYVICMDDSNKYNLDRITPKSAKIEAKLFGEWNTEGKYRRIVDDPYYGGDDGFEYNFQQIKYFSEEFLKREL